MGIISTKATATATSTLRTTLKYGQAQAQQQQQAQAQQTIGARSMATTSGVQEPNRLTLHFQQMKKTCPETIREYAQCVIQAEQAAGGSNILSKGDCDAEFAKVKACFREVRRQ